jgi:membrane-associated phospholipid phosphatase
MTASVTPLAPLVELERSLLIGWRTLPHTSAGDRTAMALSQFADHAQGWVALGLLGAACDRPSSLRWLGGAATVAGTEQASRLLKRLVRRARPELVGLPPLAAVTARYSFPSSHTATAVAATFAFRGLVPRPALIGWAALTGASRPYLGVHYPSDVLGGALLGYLAGKLACKGLADISRAGTLGAER